MRLKHEANLLVTDLGELQVVECGEIFAIEQDFAAGGAIHVPMICSSVLFPEPLGPTMARDSPRATLRETPLNTGTLLVAPLAA
jgi:hypothetical protein